MKDNEKDLELEERSLKSLEKEHDEIMETSECCLYAHKLAAEIADRNGKE